VFTCCSQAFSSCFPAPAVYNISNSIDVQQTEQRLVEYERSNRASIISNQARVVRVLKIKGGNAAYRLRGTASMPKMLKLVARFNAIKDSGGWRAAAAKVCRNHL